MYRLHVIGVLGAEGWAALLCMWTSSFYNKEYTQSAGSHNSLYEKKKKQKKLSKSDGCAIYVHAINKTPFRLHTPFQKGRFNYSM